MNKLGLWRYDLALLFIAILGFFCIGLGAHPYMNPSEARYIEIPREMLASGDWLTPHINGVPYFEKPPLFYWMQGAAMGIFGSDEWAGRIVTALLSTLTCLITYAVGRMLYGRKSGLLAALVLSTSLMGYGLAHVAMLDIPVSFFITACIACFFSAQHTENLKVRRNLYLLMYVASALAMMTKGLIGIVIPGIVIGAWIALTRQWRILKEVHLILGGLIFLAIVVPWHWLMAHQHPEFLNFYFIHEHFTRYLTNEHKRTAPWWFFIAITPVGLLPWTFITSFRRKPESSGIPLHQWLRLDPGLRRDDGQGDKLFLLLWIALPLIFFSTSHSKLISYIFPIFPPLAILIGHALTTASLKQLRVNAIGMAVVLGALLIAMHLLPALPGKAGQKLAMLTAISWPMLLPIIVALAYLVITLIRRRPPLSLIGALALVGVGLGFTANYGIAPLDMSTTKPLTDTLKQRLAPNDMVAAYGSYWQDLPVYLNRTVTVVGWTGELSFGVTHYPNTLEWMILPDVFWQRCATAPAHVYVFIKEGDFAALKAPKDCPLHITAQYGKTLLLEKR